jgi:hypothetical protein
MAQFFIRLTKSDLKREFYVSYPFFEHKMILASLVKYDVLYYLGSWNLYKKAIKYF